MSERCGVQLVNATLREYIKQFRVYNCLDFSYCFIFRIEFNMNTPYMLSIRLTKLNVVDSIFFLVFLFLLWVGVRYE